MFKWLRTWALQLPRPWRLLLLLAFDTSALFASIWASFALRFESWAPPLVLEEIEVLVLAPIVALPIFVRMGLYRSVVRYLPERAIWTMLQAVTIAALLWFFIAFLLQAVGRGLVPRSVPIIYWALAAIVVISSRFAAKWLFWPLSRNTISQRMPVLIYGAGAAGTQLAMSLRASHFIVGFLDDDPGLHRREVAGIRVYDPKNMALLIRDFGVKQVILSMPSIASSRRKEIIEAVGGHGVKVQSLPGLSDIVAGRYLVSQIREIEVEELLGRSSVPPDLEMIRMMIEGRSVMVTGAGGSIGSELCRKIAQWRPQRLVLFEANEFALYNIQRELEKFDSLPHVAILGSVVDERRVAHAIGEYKVEAIFHAAAYKHVPLVEANVLEGVRNNVFGTLNVADTAFRLGVRDFVLISTDKAVRPTNVMGATKRWAELIVHEMATRAASAQSGQRFSSVRFGNVLGSNGSVVPLFKEQIANGGPVTVTDPAMTRYFMSIREAAELIVQAGALSSGGDVFLLDMGEPVLISDLAKKMIQLAGLSVRSSENPGGDIEIKVIGRRPGEKLHEELFYDTSTATGTMHPKIMRGKTSSAPVADVEASLNALSAALAAENSREARDILFAVIARTQ
jgi:FlaA1/EpsC-like NDP-sugar epimerase